MDGYVEVVQDVVDGASGVDQTLQKDNSGSHRCTYKHCIELPAQTLDPCFFCLLLPAEPACIFVCWLTLYEHISFWNVC